MKRKPLQKRLNLVPLELRPSKLNAQLLRSVLIFGLLFTPALGVSMKFFRWKLESESQILALQKDDLAKEIQNQIRLREAASEHLAMQTIQKAISEKLYWAEIFKELSTVAPKAVWLTNFETRVEENSKFVVITGSATSQQEIAEFFARLEQSFYFRNVAMKYSEAQEGSHPIQYKFQFEGKVHDATLAGGAR